MKFNRPKFVSDKHIEVRFTENEVALYMTPKGARWLGDQLYHLAEGRDGDHIHLEDFQILTDGSLSLVVGMIVNVTKS